MISSRFALFLSTLLCIFFAGVCFEYGAFYVAGSFVIISVITVWAFVNEQLGFDTPDKLW